MPVLKISTLLLAGLAMSACGDRVPPPLPPPVVEVYSAGPPGAIWIQGHYYWYGDEYRWRHGYWMRRPYRGAYWHEGRYERHREGYVYVRGHW